MGIHKLTQSHSAVSALSDWRTLSCIAGVFAAALGFWGFWILESPWWVAFWGALLVGLVWVGRDVRLRPVGGLPRARSESQPRARPFEDGPLVMIQLAGGTFWMGSPDSDNMAQFTEKPRHEVTVGSFRIGRTPVINSQWRSVMGGEQESDDELPVNDVGWMQAIEFCNRASRQQNYQPCYREVGFWFLRRWVCDWRADGYRLPTEAEWEFACRAGAESRWTFGDDADELDAYAWFGDNSDGKAHPVASKFPNAWGLYDMHGNVWEWCWDWYGAYDARACSNPHGARRGPWRVLRGGSFGFSPELLRSAYRTFIDPGDWFRFGGFRCVRVPARQVDRLGD